MAVDALLILLTFALGAVLGRVSLCAVAAVQQWVTLRDPAGLLRLLLAAGSAALVLLTLSRLWPAQVLLPADPAPNRWMIVGGVLLGIGALLNGACYLGSVLYLGAGNLNFLFTLLGVALGLRIADLPLALPMSSAATLRPGGVPVLPIVLCAIAVSAIALGLRRLAVRRTRPTSSSPSPPVSGALWTALAGALAGLVYARHPGWSYGQVLAALAHADLAPMSWLANLAALALFAGAIAAALAARRWHLQRPAAARAARCLAGGALMGYGATLVPGGNDMLLLWALPGFSRYGLIGYGVMLLTLYLALAWAARVRRDQAPAG